MVIGDVDVVDPKNWPCWVLFPCYIYLGGEFIHICFRPTGGPWMEIQFSAKQQHLRLSFLSAIIGVIFHSLTSLSFEGCSSMMSKEDMIDLEAFLTMLNLNVDFSFVPMNEKSSFVDLHPRDGGNFSDPGSSRMYKVGSDLSIGKIFF